MATIDKTTNMWYVHTRLYGLLIYVSILNCAFHHHDFLLLTDR
jgi:hypothetical protein